MTPLEPTDLVAVTLNAADWNVVLQALGEAPYRVAAPVVTNIVGQVQAHQEARPAHVKPNGAAHPSDAHPHPDAGA